MGEIPKLIGQRYQGVQVNTVDLPPDQIVAFRGASEAGSDSLTDKVRYQWPPAGTRPTRDQLLTLVIYEKYRPDPRPPPAVVPDVIGLPALEAQLTLAKAGIVAQMAEGNRPVPPHGQAGQVYLQSLPPGMELERGERVQVLVYADRPIAAAVVPNLVGEHGETASDVLARLGMFPRLEPSDREATTVNESYKVTAQSPPEGTHVDHGESVHLKVTDYTPRTNVRIVSGGNSTTTRIAGGSREQKTVPDLTGLSAVDAKKRLADVGLTIEVAVASRTRKPPPSAKDARKVFAQDPPAGATLQEGDPVAVTIYAKLDAPHEYRPVTSTHQETSSSTAYIPSPASTTSSTNEPQSTAHAPAGEAPGAQSSSLDVPLAFLAYDREHLLFVCDPSIGKSREVFRSGNPLDHPTWSPDRRRVLFGGSKGGKRQIYQASADGSGAQPFLAGEAGATVWRPTYSPAGNVIALEHLDFSRGFFFINPDGSNFRHVNVQGANPLPDCFLPDGSGLLCTGTIGGARDAISRRQIFLVKPSGETVQLTHPANASCAGPVVSPDGRSAIFALVPHPSGRGNGFVDYNNDLTHRKPAILDLQTGAIREVFPEGTWIWQWMADGRRIVFTRAAGGDNRTLCIINADGSGLAEIAGAQNIAVPIEFAPAPAGNFIALSPAPNGEEGVFIGQIQGASLKNLRKVSNLKGSDLLWAPARAN